MSNSLYYGEIAAKLSAYLYQNPEQILQLDLLINNQAENGGDSIWTICADAARVFDTLEDLSGEQYVDWHKALESYADELLENLIRKPFDLHKQLYDHQLINHLIQILM